jgi:hypothetical protein
MLSAQERFANQLEVSRRVDNGRKPASPLDTPACDAFFQ